MTDTSVRVFQSTDSGAPTLSGIAGSLITVLDACLQNGYGSVTIDSLVVAANVATVTDSTGHGFTALGNTGPVVRISGATPAGLNGDWRITVVSATVFTFTTAGISDQTASGTIVCKRAPAGFTKAFSGTNLAAYRSDDVTGTRLYLRADDTSEYRAQMIMYESMTDINTGTGASVSTPAEKSSYSGSTARTWVLVADSRAIYLFVDSYGNGAWQGGFYFGDVVSYKSGDAYACGLIGSSGGVFYLSQFGGSSYSHLSRSYSQVGGMITAIRYGYVNQTYIGNATKTPYPSPVDNAIHLSTISVWEDSGGTVERGIMPGIYSPIHLSAGLPAHGAVIDDVFGIGSLLIQSVSGYKSAINITGPWRSI